METATATGEMTVVERFQLKAFVEAVMVGDEGVAATKDVELGMMMGAGILPGPLTRADEAGLDAMLERLELAEREWGDGFAPPLLLRRLVNQGRLGKKAGQGFFFYPRPDEGADQTETVLLETRGELAILWLNRPPTTPISPQMIRDLTALWDEIESRDEIRAAIVASSNFAVFCAGADIKEFTKMTDPAAGKELLDGGHGVLRRMEQSGKVTVAAVNSLALGGGCELAMACDFRVDAESARFGQQEINLGTKAGRAGARRGRADQEGVGEGRSRSGHSGGEGRLCDRVLLRGRTRGHRRVPREAQAEVAGEVISITAPASFGAKAPHRVTP